MALGAVIGGTVGVEWGFSLAFFSLCFLDRVAVFWEVVIDRVTFWALFGIAAGTLGGLLWGRVARTVLAFNVMALVGGFLGAWASHTLQPTIVPIVHQMMNIRVRDGDGYGLDAWWVILGAVLNGVWGASGYSIYLVGRSTRPMDD